MCSNRMEHMSLRMLNKSFVFQLLSPKFHPPSSVQISGMTHSKIFEHVQFDNGIFRQESVCCAGDQAGGNEAGGFCTRGGGGRKKAEKEPREEEHTRQAKSRLRGCVKKARPKTLPLQRPRCQGGKSRSTPCRCFKKNAVQQQSVGVEQALRPSHPVITFHLTRHGAGLQQRPTLFVTRSTAFERDPAKH